MDDVVESEQVAGHEDESDESPKKNEVPFSLAHSLSMLRRRQEEQQRAREKQEQELEEQRKQREKDKRKRRRQNQKQRKAAKAKAEAEASLTELQEPDGGGESVEAIDDTAAIRAEVGKSNGKCVSPHQASGSYKRPAGDDDTDTMKGLPIKKRLKLEAGRSMAAEEEATKSSHAQSAAANKLKALIPRALLIKKRNNHHNSRQ